VLFQKESFSIASPARSSEPPVSSALTARQPGQPTALFSQAWCCSDRRDEDWQCGMKADRQGSAGWAVRRLLFGRAGSSLAPPACPRAPLVRGRQGCGLAAWMKAARQRAWVARRLQSGRATMAGDARTPGLGWVRSPPAFRSSRIDINRARAVRRKGFWPWPVERDIDQAADCRMQLGSC